MKQNNLNKLKLMLLNHSIKCGIFVFFLLFFISFYDFYSLFPKNNNQEFALVNKKKLENIDLSVNDFKPIFGYLREQPKIEISAEVPKTKLNMKLKGVLLDISDVNSDNASVIIGFSNRQEKFFKLGDRIANNITLIEITQSHVLLEVDGKPEKLSLEKNNTLNSIFTEDKNKNESLNDENTMLKQGKFLEVLRKLRNEQKY